MALSQEERRVLAQLEMALAAEDPWLDRKLAKAGHLVPARLGTAVVGFVAGLALLVLGTTAAVAVSVLGFVVMLAAALIGVHTRRRSLFEPPTRSIP